ncbi:hypothetical protein [Planococcus sp. 4-30]|uniref:hypothetical protein n=1 Tax=Planococcus sp. 4-30 TaxID=2874583 RepID=UPI001CBE728E|nr:hypothetical protein [Planococcus sp. 4-30]
MEDINVSFNYELNETELAIIKASLGKGENGNNLESLNGIAKAAFEEYLKLIVGQKVFTRGSDIKEYRLFLMTKYMFDGKVPSEDSVSKLFQLTHSESKSLIRSVMSKYQYEMSDMIKLSLKETLGSAEAIQTDQGTLDVYKVDIKTHNILIELNKILGHLDGAAPMIVKERGTFSTYVIKPTSYDKLKIYFDND